MVINATEGFLGGTNGKKKTKKETPGTSHSTMPWRKMKRARS